MDDAVPRPLQRVLDRQAIADVLARYARGIDRCDFELVRSCYHPGATDDHGRFKGTVEEFIPWVQGVLARFDSTMHFLGNQLIEFSETSPDVAHAETYAVAYHRLTGENGEPSDHVVGLRYVDRVEQRHREWRIAERAVVVEWNRTETVETRPWGHEYLQGRRDGTDPVFRAL